MTPVDAHLEGRRLHASTLLQRLLQLIPGLVLSTLPLWREPEQLPGFLLPLVLFAGLYVAVAVPLALARFLRFRYWVTPGEIVIRSGVFTTQHRNIPIERIQNVEVHQPLLPRVFGTARVQVVTAGSATAEGVIEFISLAEAEEIRRRVRQYQRQAARAAPPSTDVEPEAASAAAPASRVVLEMPLRRVLLCGMYRFSLLYIVVVFSGIQYLNLEPEEVIGLLAEEPFAPVARFVAESPVLAVLAGVFLAGLFSWVAGIVVHLNRYRGFRLSREADKLHRRAGLLTVREGTIPLRKIQAVIFRANALMRWRGWNALHVQTMGVDADQQGHQVAVPFARTEEVHAVLPEIRPFTLPERYERVSRLTIRRATIRYTLLLIVAVAAGSIFWSDAPWLLLSWPLLPAFAYLQYRNHGFAFDGEHLFVRRGVLIHYVWVLPVDRFQVLYMSASLFQRRLRLATVYVDTAGASSLRVPEIVDLAEGRARALLSELYAATQPRAGGAPPEPLPFWAGPPERGSRPGGRHAFGRISAAA